MYHFSKPSSILSAPTQTQSLAHVARLEKRCLTFQDLQGFFKTCNLTGTSCNALLVRLGIVTLSPQFSSSCDALRSQRLQVLVYCIKFGLDAGPIRRSL